MHTDGTGSERGLAANEREKARIELQENLFVFIREIRGGCFSDQ
jgi:hypothetical protein